VSDCGHDADDLDLLDDADVVDVLDLELGVVLDLDLDLDDFAGLVVWGNRSEPSSVRGADREEVFRTTTPRTRACVARPTTRTCPRWTTTRAPTRASPRTALTEPPEPATRSTPRCFPTTTPLLGDARAGLALMSRPTIETSSKRFDIPTPLFFGAKGQPDSSPERGGPGEKLAAVRAGQAGLSAGPASSRRS
jgi:hypothetical protein